MANKQSLTETLGLLLILVIALAVTPNVATSTTDAKYVPATEYKEIQPLVSNSTSALAHSARNDSATYAYFTILLNDTSAYGLTEVDCSSNITYTVATKIVLFKDGVFDDGKIYNCTILYYWNSMSGTAQETLLDLVPLLWIVAIIGAIVVFVTKKLRMW